MNTTHYVQQNEPSDVRKDRPLEGWPSSSSESAEPGPSRMPLPMSVVVPVRNEARFIKRTLDQLLAQHYEPDLCEIHVVDGESTDGTRELVDRFVRRHKNVYLHTNPKWLSSAARNIGIRNSRGDVILIVDGHCDIPDRHMLTRLARAFQESGADCVGRPQPLDVERATALQRAIAAARASWLGHHPDSHVYSDVPGFVPAASVAVAYRREVFERVGYFDEYFDACEDYELNVSCDRVGLQCYFAPELAVRYYPRKNLGGLFRQLYRYGRGRVRLGRKLPDTWSYATLVPPAFITGVAAGWIPALFSPLLGLTYLSLLLIYVAVVLGVSARAALRYRQLSLLYLLPLVFPTIHAGSGCGVLAELLKPKRGKPTVRFACGCHTAHDDGKGRPPALARDGDNGHRPKYTK